MTETETKTETKTDAKQNGGTVRFRAPRTADNEPIFVGLNGKNYLIRRGEEVHIPIGVAEILINAEKAEDALSRFVDKV